MNEAPDAPYALRLAPPARRSLSERLPEVVAAAVWEFISGPLVEKPHRVGAPLVAPFEGVWRARRGEYRVRYTIDDEQRVVLVLAVAHRRDAYRP